MRTLAMIIFYLMSPAALGRTETDATTYPYSSLNPPNLEAPVFEFVKPALDTETKLHPTPSDDKLLQSHQGSVIFTLQDPIPAPPDHNLTSPKTTTFSSDHPIPYNIDINTSKKDINKHKNKNQNQNKHKYKDKDKENYKNKEKYKDKEKDKEKDKSISLPNIIHSINHHTPTPTLEPSPLTPPLAPKNMAPLEKRLEILATRWGQSMVQHLKDLDLPVFIEGRHSQPGMRVFCGLFLKPFALTTLPFRQCPQEPMILWFLK